MKMNYGSALPGNNTGLKYLTLFVIFIEPSYLPDSNPLAPKLKNSLNRIELVISLSKFFLYLKI